MEKEKVKKEKKSTEAKAPEIHIDALDTKGIESLQYYFGKRKLEAFDNSDILKTRLLYHMESAKKENCFDIFSKSTNGRIGTVSHIQLEFAWRIANSNDAKKACYGISLAMTESEWNEDKEKLEKYLRNNNIVASGRPVLFNHVLSISESEYESIGLKKPKQVTVLLQMAILGEIAENERLIATWKKIKRYPHKIPLEASAGGVFTYEDAAKLRSIGIKYLNDIRKRNIYQIKNLLMVYDFERLVQNINTAYKNDLERRKDTRYKVLPFVAGFFNVIAVLLIAYVYKYTLIKNSDMTTVIILGFILMGVDAITVFFGGKRGKRRRRVRPEYVYYSYKVKKAIKIFSTIFIFTTISVLVFYLRYDGYDDILYYRNIGDNEITIANLRDESVEILHIPATIDDKTVTEIDARAFKKTDLQKVYVPDTVEKIEKKAFKKCSDLEDIVLPDSISEIGKAAFLWCYNLSDIEIPEKMTTISKNTFKNTGLKSLVIPETVKITVESGAFKGCDHLTRVVNMSNITVIGDNAFENCMALQELNLSSDLTDIGARAFAGCETITKIDIPKSVISIGKRAFNGCESVKTINVPNTVESIGKDAFRNCNSLTSLAIPYTGTSAEKSFKQNINSIVSISDAYDREISVTYVGDAPIGSKAFKGANWITKLIINDGVPSIEGGAMRDMDSLEYIKLPTTVTEIPDNLFEGCAMLTSVAGMENVKIIGSEAFRKCYALEYIDLKNIEEIKEGCFEECTNLSSVGTLTKLHTIGDNAFYNCIMLNIDGGLTNVNHVGASAFYDCDNISSLGFTSAKISYIGDKAFYDCDGIYNVDLSDTNIEYLGDEAFYDCDGIYNVNLSDSEMEYLGDEAFYGCDDIYRIDISEAKMTYLGEMAFYRCANVTYVDLSYAIIEKVADQAFSNCHSLVEVVLSNSNISEIGVEMFSYCSSLETALLSSKMVEIPESMFEECYNLTTVNLYAIKPEIIRENAFFNCNLSAITLNDGLETIEDNAFRGNNMWSVDIPDSVTYMGESCFADCYSLTTFEAPFIGEKINKDGGYKWLFGRYAQLEHIRVTKAEKIYSDTFNRGQDSLMTIELNEGITVIESSAFEDFVNLYSINIPSTVEKIGKSAFQNCESITSVTIPKGVTKIANKTFKNCIELTDVNFSTMEVKSIGRQAFRNTNVGYDAIIFNKNLEDIGRNAFAECGVYSVTYSEAMEDISISAFGRDPYMTVYVPYDLYDVYTEKYKDEMDVNVVLNSANRY